jgi:hypothetical protein
VSEREWQTYYRARELWLDAAALSRSEGFICRTFGACVAWHRGFTGWWS